MENRGRTIENLLVTKDPWEGSCLQEDCFTCTSGKPGKCLKQNATYRIDCLLCKEEDGRTSTYFGETGRCSFDRGLEHLTALEEGEPESVLVQHMIEDHPNEAPKFQMKIVKSKKADS